MNYKFNFSPFKENHSQMQTQVLAKRPEYKV